MGQKKVKTAKLKTEEKAAFDIRKEAAAAGKQVGKELSESQGRQAFATRGNQGLIRDLQAQAAGQGPSLAEAQLRSASNRSLAQQLAAAASGRGGNPAALQRQVMQQQGAASRDLAEQAATARIQEQQVARQQLGSQLAQEQAAADNLVQNYIAKGYDYATAAKLMKQDMAKLRFGAQTQANAANAANSNALTGSLIGAGATLGAAALTGPAAPITKQVVPEVAQTVSDEKQKKDIKPAKKEVSSFLDALKAREYEYKHPEMPGAGEGRQVSVMAQDLEKSKMGKQMVKESPNGKMVDYGKGFQAILAAQAELHNRMKKLEGKKKA